MEWLRIRPEGTYVDATAGTGGHAIEIARRLTTGRLAAIDRDPRALEIARERLKQFEGKVVLVHAEFSTIGDVVAKLNLPPLDGVIADLGVSSLELDTPERGFSFRWAAPLDMRMNPTVALNGGRNCESLAGKAVGRPALSQGGGAGFTQNRQGHRSSAADPRYRTPGNGCGRSSKSKGKAETAARDKNVSGAAECGESRRGGTRAVSFADPCHFIFRRTLDCPQLPLA